MFKRVELENFEACHVEDSDERGSLSLSSVQGTVDTIDEPLEHTLVTGLGDGFNGELYLFLCLRLGDELAANFDARCQECLGHVGDPQAQQVSNFLSNCIVGQSCLVIASLLLERHRSEEQDRADDSENGIEIVLSHAHNVHALHCCLVLRGIVNAGNWKTTVGQEGVASDVIENETLALLSRSACQQLVEDMERTLVGGLTDRSRLLEQIGLDVSTGNVAGSVEIDSNELSL